MKRSQRRTLTTRVGSLPRPDDLIPLLRAKDSGQAYDKDELARGVAKSVADVVRGQAELGIDVVNDGEHSKSGFSSYHLTHLAGFSVQEAPPEARQPSRDQAAFPAVYQEMRAMFATRPVRTARRLRDAPLVCTGPVSYIGQGPGADRHPQPEIGSREGRWRGRLHDRHLRCRQLWK